MKLSALASLAFSTVATSFYIPVHQPQGRTLAASAALGRCSGSVSNFPFQRSNMMKLWGGGESADDEEEEIIPGKMKVSEIKAELDLRGISYAGVYDRAALEEFLTTARKKGQARPEILDQFSEQVEQQKQRSTEGKEQDLKHSIDWDAATAGDGTVPGGVSADAMKELVDNKELMDFATNPQLQELMRAVMMKDDQKVAELSANADVIKMLDRFQSIMADSGVDLSAFNPKE